MTEGRNNNKQGEMTFKGASAHSIQMGNEVFQMNPIIHTKLFIGKQCTVLCTRDEIHVSSCHVCTKSFPSTA